MSCKVTIACLKADKHFGTIDFSVLNRMPITRLSCQNSALHDVVSVLRPLCPCSRGRQRESWGRGCIEVEATFRQRAQTLSLDRLVRDRPLPPSPCASVRSSELQRPRSYHVAGKAPSQSSQRVYLSVFIVSLLLNICELTFCTLAIVAVELLAKRM